MTNPARWSQAIPRVSSSLYFVTLLCLFVSTYLGYFERVPVSKKIRLLHPFSVAENLMAKPPERSLIKTINKVEKEIRIQINRPN